MKECLLNTDTLNAQNLVTADTWQLGHFTHEYTNTLKVVLWVTSRVGTNSCS